MSEYPITIDWSTYLFHCSSLPNIMTSGRGKDELLGETAKACLRELWIYETYGRKKFDSKNRFTEKGIKVESDSLEIVSNVLGTPLFKNVDTLKNAYLVGTPDVVKPTLRDIKSSWDIFTFFSCDEKKARAEYFWQMVGYMMLTGSPTAELTYVLTTTPPEITEGELYKTSFYLTEEETELARRNFEYEDIPEKYRVRNYTFSITEEDEIAVAFQIQAAREYLTSLNY